MRQTKTEKKDPETGFECLFIWMFMSSSFYDALENFTKTRDPFCIFTISSLYYFQLDWRCNWCFQIDIFEGLHDASTLKAKVIELDVTSI